MPRGVMDEVFKQEPAKGKPSEIEVLENKLAALEEERRRRLNADVTSGRTGRKIGPSKEEMADLNSRMSAIRKQLATARANFRRDVAHP